MRYFSLSQLIHLSMSFVVIKQFSRILEHFKWLYECEEFVKSLYFFNMDRRKTLRASSWNAEAKQGSCVVYYWRSIQEWVQMTDTENKKITPPLKLMNKNEVMKDLLKLLDLVQKHMLIKKDVNIVLTY